MSVPDEEMIHHHDQQIKALEKRIKALEPKSSAKAENVVEAKIKKKASTQELIECTECNHRLFNKGEARYCIYCEIEY